MSLLPLPVGIVTHVGARLAIAIIFKRATFNYQLVTISFQAPLLSYSILHLAGTPSGIRTHTVPSLNRMTLPIGLQEHIGTQGWT